MELEEIRQEIDGIDEQMKTLFLQRMDLSRRVIETKKKTGAAVYAKEREREIINARSTGVDQEYFLECRTFFRHMMEVSRTYQYSNLVKMTEKLHELPEGEGTAVIEFFCEGDCGQMTVFLNAAMLAGLKAAEITAEEQEEGIRCRLCLRGDFSSMMAKAAVLQILEENETAVILV